MTTLSTIRYLKTINCTVEEVAIGFLWNNSGGKLVLSIYFPKEGEFVKGKHLLIFVFFLKRFVSIKQS